MKKINIGCGNIIAPNWINYDISYNILLSKHPLLKKILYKRKIISKNVYETKWPSEVIRHDVRKGLPHEESCIDYIYSSHFFEHIKKGEMIKILYECKRVLKEDGWIRIVLPDIKLLAFKYINNEIDINEFLSNFNMTDANENKIVETIFGRDKHYWMYDYESIESILMEVGFSNIYGNKFREGEVPDLEILDTREAESMYIEAQK